jgi:predicted TIM-barrel fold metal-dependent hydrolase
VRPLVDGLESIYKKMPQEFDEHPVEAFRRNVYVNPFWEDALEGLVDIMGPERLLFGSDYPHPEGLGDPVSFVDDLPESLSPEDTARIMGGNLHELLHLNS